MSNFLQTLFNTNHDQPSFLVFVVLAFIAIVVPNLSEYIDPSFLYGRKKKKKKR